jgi:hypothetical protein
MEELEIALGNKLGGELEQRIEAKFAEFGGLLTREAAVLLLAKENGIPIEKELALSDAPKTSLPFSFTAKVERIFPLQVYPNGIDRSVRLHLSDASGEATLLLWNSQCGLVEGEIGWGDTVSGSGAFFRNGEISIGKSGNLKSVARHPILTVSGLAPGQCCVEGEVGKVGGGAAQVGKKFGDGAGASYFQLCQDGSCCNVVVWQKPEGFLPLAGDRVVLENVIFRNGEVHFNSYSRMVRKGSALAALGEMQSVSFEGDMALIGISGKSYSVALEEALLLFEVKGVPPGISAQTLIEVKASGLAGKKVQFKLQDGKLCLLAAVKEGK